IKKQVEGKDSEATKKAAKRLAEVRVEIRDLEEALQRWKEVQKSLSANPRPTRLQLAWALVAAEEKNWIKTIVSKRFKLEVYHFDRSGTRVLSLSGLIDQDNPSKSTEVTEKILDLEALGQNSPLGTAVERIVNEYRGSSLAGVILLTDGAVTIGDKLSEAAEKTPVPLYFIGIGKHYPWNDLKLTGVE